MYSMSMYDADLAPCSHILYRCTYYTMIIIYIYIFIQQRSEIGRWSRFVIEFCCFFFDVLGIRFEGNNPEKNSVPTSAVLLFVVCWVINNDLWHLRLYTVFQVQLNLKMPPQLYTYIIQSVYGEERSHISKTLWQDTEVTHRRTLGINSIPLQTP